MYLTSLIHRDALFDLTERWLCGRLEPDDGLRLTHILIADDFVLAETLESIVGMLLDIVHGCPFSRERIHLKGELRDAICRDARVRTVRVKELIGLYEANPEFFYRDVPINGVMYRDDKQCLLALSRIKRPRRIAEKANRYVANWIFGLVRRRAQEMAALRARKSAVPLEGLITPPDEMEREFISAERSIAQQFRDGIIHLERDALSIHDVGGIKIVADADPLTHLEKTLADHSSIRVIALETFSGNYQARSLIVEVPWDRERICRRFLDCRGWDGYLNRGIEEREISRGLEPLLEGARPTLNLEVILSTFPDMVESELGISLHEERIMAQRDSRVYRGYVPMNVEFLIEYLFAVGISPSVRIELLPIKLWGRYLPDTVIEHIRALYRYPPV